ncbi:MAG: helix-turn-helix domain-containing protein [Burkholderiaceae bacterium]|nr:helix-turn-helix domain-containing protein [Burkholderiaceae bacterium]
MSLITVEDIAAQLKVSRRVVNERIVRHPEFPRPALALNHKVRRWSREDVEAWLAKQAKKMAR